MQIALSNKIHTISIKINEAHIIIYENERREKKKHECQLLLFGAFIYY